MDRTGPRRRTGHWKGTLEDNLPLEGWVVHHYYSLDAGDDYPRCQMCLFQRPRHRFVMHHDDTAQWADVGCECCVHMVDGDRSFADSALAEMKAKAARVDALAKLFRPVDDPLWDDTRRWESEGIAFEVYGVGDAWTASARHPVHDYVLWRRGGHRSRFEALTAIREECLTHPDRQPVPWLWERMPGRTLKKGLPKLRVDGQTFIVAADGRCFKLLRAREDKGWRDVGGGFPSIGHALRFASRLLGWA